MSMVGFPLLLIPLAIYNIIVFLMPGVAFNEPLLRLRLVSGEIWGVTLGDMLLAVAVLLLLLEIVKGARPGGKYLTDHLLSLLVAGAASAEFVMWPKFGNSIYFLLALLAVVDFFGGIALRTKRRARAMAVAAPAAPRQEIEPKPVVVTAPAAITATSVPPATEVAESVLLDHPAPRIGGIPPSETFSELHADSTTTVPPQSPKQ